MSRVRTSTQSKIEYPHIDPIDMGVGRPFWSVMIPTYNCAVYLERTLKSVLKQDPGPDEMQIEVVDDCSTKDDPEEVTRRVGKGRVAFSCHSRNLGASASFTTCIERARGHWVHILHGDDAVLPEFYNAYKRFICSHPEAIMIFSRAIAMDENDDWIEIMFSPPRTKRSGYVQDAAQDLRRGNFICAPTAVVARSAYVNVGGFKNDLYHCGDWEMWIRLADYGRLGYVHEPVLLYRVHSGSDTAQQALDAQNIKEIAETIDIGVAKLRSDLGIQVRAEARRTYSKVANSYRYHYYHKGLYKPSLRHAVWAFKLHPSLFNLLRLVRSLLGLVKSAVGTQILPVKQATQ